MKKGYNLQQTTSIWWTSGIIFKKFESCSILYICFWSGHYLHQHPKKLAQVEIVAEERQSCTAVLWKQSTTESWHQETNLYTNKTKKTHLQLLTTESKPLGQARKPPFYVCTHCCLFCRPLFIYYFVLLLSASPCSKMQAGEINKHINKPNKHVS